MADFDFKTEIVTLGGIADTSYTHDSVAVTVTATMKQGSILNAAGVEIAAAGFATAAGVIDDLTFRRHADTLTVGDVVLASIAKRGLILNESAITYSDAAIDAAGKAALVAAGLNKFAAVADDAAII